MLISQRQNSPTALMAKLLFVFFLKEFTSARFKIMRELSDSSTELGSVTQERNSH